MFISSHTLQQHQPPVLLIGRRNGEVQFLNTQDCIPDVGLDREYSSWCGHLHHVVGEVRNGHELGQSRTAKNAVVRKRRISDIEHDGLRAEVLLVPERDRKSYLPQRTSDIPIHALKQTRVL